MKTVCQLCLVYVRLFVSVCMLDWLLYFFTTSRHERDDTLRLPKGEPKVAGQRQTLCHIFCHAIFSSPSRPPSAHLARSVSFMATHFLLHLCSLARVHLSLCSFGFISQDTLSVSGYLVLEKQTHTTFWCLLSAAHFRLKYTFLF